MPHRMDDDFLIRFLRARSFNVNRAHRLVSYICFEIPFNLYFPNVLTKNSTKFYIPDKNLFFFYRHKKVLNFLINNL